MRDEAEKHDLIQRQREQRLFFQRRMEERREKLSQQRQEVSRDRADFEARANLSREERKQAFMDRRQAASGQRRGPEPER